MLSLAKIQFYDHKVFYWLQRPAYPAIVLPISKALSFSANGPAYVIAALILGVCLQFQTTAVLALGFTLERLVYFTFKPTFKRARPSAALPSFVSQITPSDQFSFPSGHTSGAFVFAGLTSHYCPKLFPFLLVWACGVGLSRVLLGVHFLTDVFAGALVGWGLASGIEAWL